MKNRTTGTNTGFIWPIRILPCKTCKIRHYRHSFPFIIKFYKLFKVDSSRNIPLKKSGQEANIFLKLTEQVRETSQVLFIFKRVLLIRLFHAVILPFFLNQIFKNLLWIDNQWKNQFLNQRLKLNDIIDSEKLVRQQFVK